MKKKTACFTIIIVIMLTSLFLSGCDSLLLGKEPVIIISQPKTSAVPGELYKYQLVIEPDDVTKIVFNLDTAPQGMTIDGSGLIKWTPTEAQLGLHNVKAIVKNARYFDDQKFEVAVGQVQLKSISVVPLQMSFTSTNSSRKIDSITAHYTDDSSAKIDITECSFQSNNTSVATVGADGTITAKKVGNAIITVSYTEKEITVSTTITVSITAPTPGGGG